MSRGPLSVADLSHQFGIAQFKLKNKPARSAVFLVMFINFYEYVESFGIFSDRKAQNLSNFIFSVVSNIIVLFFCEAENLSNFILSNIIDLSNIMEWSV